MKFDNNMNNNIKKVEKNLQSSKNAHIQLNSMAIHNNEHKNNLISIVLPLIESKKKKIIKQFVTKCISYRMRNVT